MIIGSTIPLTLALSETWQYPLAALSLLVLRRGVVIVLLSAGAIGLAAGLLGAPLPHPAALSSTKQRPPLEFAANLGGCTYEASSR